MIKLVTISRISKEKGFERMITLEGLLSASGVPFIWDCYGDTTTRHAKEIIPRFRHVKFKGVTSTPKDIVKNYDYLVQLSDTEGFPYSIYEAMQQKIPVIATDFPSIREMLIDGKNGYILDMDLSNFDVEKIKQVPTITKFKEKSNENNWIKFIDMATRKSKGTGAAKGTTNARKIISATVGGATCTFIPIDSEVTVKASRRYFDTEMNRNVAQGEELTVSKERAGVLVKAKVGTIVK